MAKSEAPFGSWKSPLTAEFVTGAGVRLGGAWLDGEGGIVWLEGRPAEKGRNVLVREASGGAAKEDLTPGEFNVRTRVHEYGGGAACVHGDTVVFSNFADQRLYMQSITGDRTPRPISPAVAGAVLRYADGEIDGSRGRFVCVREDHRQDGKEAVNEIVAVSLEGDPDADPVVLVSGKDFYSSPSVSPDGRQMAWVEWSHPSMPWDRTQLWVGQLSASGVVENKVCVAGGDSSIVEAPTEPVWSPSGELFFVSDRGSGFWNIHRWVQGERRVEAVTSEEAEFTTPGWIFGHAHYAFVDERRIVAAYRDKGVSKLALLNVSSKELLPISTPFVDVYSVVSGGGRVLVTAGSPKFAPSIVEVALGEGGAAAGGRAERVLWEVAPFDRAAYEPFLSVPESIQFPTKVEGKSAYAIYYPPTNPEYAPPGGERPPLLVMSHGGPTSEVGMSLKLSIQFWTSRGWAVADVNYGGSTGYGREYRERLYGTWGIVDVDDCCSCAEYLVAAGKADGRRLAIEGGSAGGFTTLAVLAFRDTFQAGASFYGVSELTALATDTHKFESRYLDQLIGPLDTAAEVYHERSPINHVESFSCPVILFQGLEDKVVPPIQATMMYEAVKKKGLPTALVEYEGEDHGFRKAENQRSTLEWEMLFFSKVFGFELADPVQPLHIDNLE